jgi:hypothetical protein
MLVIFRIILYHSISLGEMVYVSTSLPVNRCHNPFLSLNCFPPTVITSGSSRSTAELHIISVSPSFRMPYYLSWKCGVLFNSRKSIVSAFSSLISRFGVAPSVISIGVSDTCTAFFSPGVQQCSPVILYVENPPFNVLAPLLADLPFAFSCVML